MRGEEETRGEERALFKVASKGGGTSPRVQPRNKMLPSLPREMSSFVLLLFNCKVGRMHIACLSGTPEG